MPSQSDTSHSGDISYARRLRSYLGYPPVRDAQPNTTHFALASLLHSGNISRIITQVISEKSRPKWKAHLSWSCQNVDGLHHKALTQGAGQYWSPRRLQEHILELHGTLHVRELRCSSAKFGTDGSSVSTAGGDTSWTERSSKTCSLKRIPSGIILHRSWRERKHSRGLTQTETYVTHLQFSLGFFILTACPFAYEHV